MELPHHCLYGAERHWPQIFPVTHSPLLQPDANGKINLNIQTGSVVWLPSTATQTWGYNGNLLGPAIRLQRGKAVTIDITNALPEATTVHWHGLEIPGEVDGGPQALIQPGQSVRLPSRWSNPPQRVGSIRTLTVKRVTKWRWG